MNSDPQIPDLVFVIDDHAATRRQLDSILAKDKVRSRPFASLLTFLEWLDYDRVPDNTVVAAEIDLPELGGLDLLNIFKADAASLPTILMGTAMTVSNAVEAMHAGADYILQKPFSDCAFRGAMRRAVQSGQKLARTMTPAAPVQRRLSSLSQRQRELLIHVSEGRTNREIAGCLSISQKTVELHRAAMMQKMGAGSLAELIRIVVECGDLRQPAAHNEYV